MRYHHTKNKGDLGVIHAEADLMEKGFLILRPASEHAPFDLVAYDQSTFYRVQVKYRRMIDGVVCVKLKSSWADGNGVHDVPMDKEAVDVVCVYCPETRTCYYFDPKRFGGSVSLRVEPAENGQSKRLHAADDFLLFPRRA